MADINVGVLAEQINSKADIDLRNIDTTKCDMVIEYQEPTAENNYTWYRLYATGWIEQGGTSAAQTVSSGYGSEQTIDLLIPMEDTNYSYTFGSIGAWASRWVSNITTTSFVLTQGNRSGSGSNSQQTKWQVSGKVDPSVMLNHEILPSKAKSEEFEHRVIDFQKPTAENNYTWYRKYADGWIEQGGIPTSTSTVTLPVPMADSNYWFIIKFRAASSYSPSFSCFGHTPTTTGFSYDNAAASANGFIWRVEGMAAE